MPRELKGFRASAETKDAIAADLRFFGTRACAKKHGVSREVARRIQRQRGIPPHPRGSAGVPHTPTVWIAYPNEKTRRGKTKTFRLAWPCCPRGRAVLHWAL